MVHAPYFFVAFAAAGFSLVQAKKGFTSAVYGAGIRPRATLPGRWETINGSLWPAPSVASWGPDHLDVFGLGLDNELVHRSGDGCVWSEWEDLGNVLTGDPKVTGWTNSTKSRYLDVYGRAQNGTLQVRTLRNGALDSWTTRHPTSTPILSGLSPVFDPVTNMVWIFAAFQNVFQGLNSVAITRGPPTQNLHVFYLQEGNASVAHSSLVYPEWRSESLGGGPFLVDPAAVALGAKSMFVFAVAEDHVVQYTEWTGFGYGEGWSGWESLPGAETYSKPIVVTDRPNTFDLYIVDIDGVLRHK
ncbi:hypothetical protein QBC38DRAFT_542699 [Podospora fimiseda]|uniref:PLL-like beta propeller domain-containing protein n=1 Tax=Podospora fimiseda TaxID=252190 RepID=A0AAN7BVF0_9PEZI|nr:hypothetical protein QBC38DRAFT_542699 [Podospora fimiseda]